jgi:carboxyl-terminal processing protease
MVCMTRKIKVGAIPALLVFIIILAVGVFWWWAQANRGRYRDLLTALFVMGVVKLQYYQPVELGQLAQAYLKTGNIAGMLKVLDDPYTRFLPKADYAELRKDTDGMFGGIGIFLIPKESKLMISSVVKGSPGEAAGLLAGDRIIAVEQISVSELGVEAAIAKIKGPPGTIVKLRVVRGAGARRRELELWIKRKKIQIPTVELIWKNDSGLGQYARIGISQFAATTARDLERQLTRVERNRHCQALILDLRGNPGGELEAALQVAGKFLPEGAPVIHILRRGRPLESLTNQSRDHHDLPMVVLVDGWSASASEIVAGALKDQKRATLVGTHTFGKDLIQQIMELPGGVALSVTIASYLTSGKVNIHRKGVQPDYVVSIPGATERLLRRGDLVLFQRMRELQEQTAVRLLKQQLRNRKLAG